MTLHFWRNLTWLFEEMKIQTNMRNDGGIYRRESTRSTTRHPCSRTLKSSTTGSKMESLLSYIGCWIRVRDDDRWMQMEISAFFFSSFLFRHFPLWRNLYGMTLIEMERRWFLLLKKDVWPDVFVFVSWMNAKKGNVTKWDTTC